jgi:hypothetical protein
MDADLELMHGEIFERVLHSSGIQLCIAGLLEMALSVLALYQAFQTFLEIQDHVPAGPSFFPTVRHSFSGHFLIGPSIRRAD